MAEFVQQLRDLIAQIRWAATAELLGRLKPEDAANAVMALPFDQQRLLFRRLPRHLAAILVGQFPYFHFHIEFYPPHRSKEKLKYLAGVETGSGTFLNDSLAEEKAAELRGVPPVRREELAESSKQ